VPGVGGAPPSPWEHLNDPQPEPVEGRTTQPLPASGSSTPPRWLSLVRSPHHATTARLWEQHHAPQAEPVEARTPQTLPHGRDPSPFPPLRGGPLPSPSRGEGARVPSRRQRVPGRTAKTAAPSRIALPHRPARTARRAPPSPHRPGVQESTQQAQTRTPANGLGGGRGFFLVGRWAPVPRARGPGPCMSCIRVAEP